MKIKKSAVIALLMAFATSGAFAQSFAGNYTFTARFAEPISKTGGRTSIYSTKDLVDQMAKSFPKITPKGAVIQGVINLNGDLTFQVKNANATIVNVSSVLKFTRGINSVTLNDSLFNKQTGKRSSIVVSTGTISYNDTTLNHTSALKFQYTNVLNTTENVSPTKTKGQSNVDLIAQLSAGVGEATSWDNNSHTDLVIELVNGQLTVSGTLPTTLVNQ